MNKGQSRRENTLGMALLFKPGRSIRALGAFQARHGLHLTRTLLTILIATAAVVVATVVAALVAILKMVVITVLRRVATQRAPVRP